jgi:hypothetical protein
MLVTDSDIAYLRSLYPYLDIKPLSTQQEQYLLLHMRGMSNAEASRAAGYTDTRTGNRLLAREDVQVMIEYLRDKTLGDLRVDVETLTVMLFEAHRKSATSTEEVNAIRELGRLHALYPEQQLKAAAANITTINQINVTNTKQLARMSDAELMELAQSADSGLAALLEAPEPIAIEGEVIRGD